MQTKLAMVAVAVAALLAAFLVGYWPQREQRLAIQAEADTLRTGLAAAEGRVRAGEILGRVLTVKEITMRQNYGLALDRSSALFDAVRQEAMQTSIGGLRDSLTAVLDRRDAVTAGLAKADPASVDVLHVIELALRGSLGYEMPPAPDLAP